MGSASERPMTWALTIPHRGQTTAPVVVRFAMRRFLISLDDGRGAEDSKCNPDGWRRKVLTRPFQMNRVSVTSTTRAPRCSPRHCTMIGV